MFWIILSSLLVFVLVKFFWDRSKLGRRVVKEGGMSRKFETLITQILALDDRARIDEETSTYLCISLSGFGATTLIEILMTFRSVNITYKVLSQIYGEHKLQWEFPENEDQEYMYSKINKDISSYLEKNRIFENPIDEVTE